jgi:plastocyanin
MKSLSYRSCLAAALAALVPLAGCGDEKTQRRGRGGTTKTETDKTAKTDGGETPEKTAVEGWGHLKAKFVLKGQPPDLGEVPVNQNVDYCNPFKASGHLRNEKVVVNDKNELKNVVLYLRGKAERIHESYQADEKKEIVLDNHKCRFEPHVCLIRTGQTLRVKNSDPMGHNTKLAGPQGFNENIGAGGSITRVFDQNTGSPIEYQCDIHKWMNGHLLVLEHPYMAVSGDDGTLEIKNLPAGDWQFQLWHERPGPLEVGDWRNGRAKLTIKPNETNDLKVIEVPVERLKTP